MAQNTSATTLGKTFIITVPPSTTTNITSLQGKPTIKLPINLKDTKTITRIGGLTSINTSLVKKTIEDTQLTAVSLPSLTAVNSTHLTAVTSGEVVHNSSLPTLTPLTLSQILTDQCQRPIVGDSVTNSVKNISNIAEGKKNLPAETKPLTLTAVNSKSLTDTSTSRNLPIIVRPETIKSLPESTALLLKDLNTFAHAQKSDVKPTLPPPMIALKKEKPVIPITKMKVMKNLNVSFDNLEVAQEFVHKGNLIKSLTLQGVEFKEEMLTSINEFCNSAKLMYTEKITSLAAEVAKLEKECQKKAELIKELHALLGTKDALKSCGDDLEGLGNLRLTLQDLGGRFLRQVETSVEMALREQQTKRRNCRCGQVDGDKGAKSAETIGVAATRLVELVRGVTNEERGLYAAEMQLLLEELLNHISTDNYAVDATMIEQLPTGEPHDGPHVLRDVNMGCELQLPTVIAQVESGRDLSVAPPTGLKGQSCIVPDFYHYLRNSRMVINDHGDRPIHREVLENNIKEVKKQAIVLKLLSASLDVYNDDDYTPLHLAIIKDASVEIISTLLRYGADFRTRDGDGNTVLHLGVEANTLGKLFQPSVRQLVDEKLYHRVVDVHNNEGFTPLHLAAMRGNATLVQDLLLCDPNIDLCDTKSGRTALYHAIENNHIAATKLLKEHKACPYVKTYAGTSIIDALCEVDSDFSPEMKKLFYNDRMKVTERAYDDDVEPKPVVRRRKRKQIDEKSPKKRKS